MLEVRANNKDRENIDKLVTNLMGLIQLVSKTAKVSRNDMDRE